MSGSWINGEQHMFKVGAKNKIIYQLLDADDD